MKINNYANKAKEYSSGIKALDYGCGSGCSTLFLAELGLDIEGVDICPYMLKEASNIDNIANLK